MSLESEAVMDLESWRTALLDQLDASGPEALAASEFIRGRRVKVGFKKASPAVGAFWTIAGNLYLNNASYSVESPVTDARLICLVVHETQHLRQGLLTALSVYGELEAWQLHFRLYERLKGIRLGAPLSDLLALPLTYDRLSLRRARELMRAHGGKGYHADLLPLYPWGKEIAWWITRRNPT